jgi:hypothetical protein
LREHILKDVLGIGLIADPAPDEIRQALTLLSDRPGQDGVSLSLSGHGGKDGFHTPVLTGPEAGYCGNRVYLALGV